MGEVEHPRAALTRLAVTARKAGYGVEFRGAGLSLRLMRKPGKWVSIDAPTPEVSDPTRSNERFLGMAAGFVGELGVCVSYWRSGEHWTVAVGTAQYRGEALAFAFAAAMEGELTALMRAE